MDENNSRQANFEEGPNFVPKTILNIITKVSWIYDFFEKSSELDFYLRSLEEEMKKVDAFERELPLCMELLKDGIEKLEEKLQCNKDREMEPVMEEFILPKSNSEGDGRAKMSIDLCEKRSWMSSIQLWNTIVQYEHNFDPRNQMHREEAANSFSKNRGEGAFSPFEKPSDRVVIKDYGQRAAPVEGLSLSVPVTKDEPVDVHVKESRCLVRARPQQPQRKQRRYWSPELHRLFVDALDNLGGAEAATPKQIREQMKVEGLTNDEVKSYLQKYRIHIRRLSGL